MQGAYKKAIIYAAEDDEGIRDIIIYALQSAGFDAQGFETGEEFFDRLGGTVPNLAILDVMLPGEDGISILRRLRGANVTKDIPVIMLTAKDTELDKVKALDLGADDYISKPFGVMELISRVKAVLRRTMPADAPGEKIIIGRLTVDNIGRDVYLLENNALDQDNKIQKIDLSYKEYELLLYLAQNAGRALNRDSIINAVWGYDFEGESRTLDVHIRLLRQKLGSARKYIKTVRNVGYKMEADET
ncbi:MAG: response regulator transcription factor [Oscillospiraceae bacterium]|nr:response regulator transcription factor [Oscillospiraceae bacterium]